MEEDKYIPHFYPKQGNNLLIGYWWSERSFNAMQ